MRGVDDSATVATEDVQKHLQNPLDLESLGFWFWGFRVLRFWFWGFGVLRFWFWGFGVLRFWSLGFWGCKVLGMWVGVEA